MPAPIMTVIPGVKNEDEVTLDLLHLLSNDSPAGAEAERALCPAGNKISEVFLYPC